MSYLPFHSGEIRRNAGSFGSKRETVQGRPPKTGGKTESGTKEHAFNERNSQELHLERPPLQIECFDNSNIQGSDAVASCVVFKKAKPSKKDYRKYNIKTVVDLMTMLP